MLRPVNIHFETGPTSKAMIARRGFLVRKDRLFLGIYKNLQRLIGARMRTVQIWSRRKPKVSNLTQEIRVKRKLNSIDVLETLADVMISRGRPDYICSDNGPEFIAKTLRSWIASRHTNRLYRTRESMGKWILRKFQQQASR
jgi:hypothetical protein